MGVEALHDVTKERINNCLGDFSLEMKVIKAMS